MKGCPLPSYLSKGLLILQSLDWKNWSPNNGGGKPKLAGENKIASRIYINMMRSSPPSRSLDLIDPLQFHHLRVSNVHRAKHIRPHIVGWKHDSGRRSCYFHRIYSKG